LLKASKNKYSKIRAMGKTRAKEAPCTEHRERLKEQETKGGQQGSKGLKITLVF